MENQNKKIRIIFLSSSDFGIPALIKFSENKLFDIAGLITLPDKPKGRGFKIEVSSIKKIANERGIKILETDNMKNFEFEAKIKDLQPDVMVMASFGKIIPESFLNIAPHGVLNIHPSLLPKYRGSSPIQTAILNGDKETGVTIMFTDKEMDHGPIVRHSVFNILPKIKYKELYNKLAELGADLICEAIPDWVAGKIKADPQNESEAIYTKKIKKEDGLIDWNESAEIIERKVRAFHEWPICYFFFKKNDNMIRMQVLETEALPQSARLKNIGEFFEIDNDLAVQTGDGILKLLIVKPEGKKEIRGQDFLKGYKWF